MCIILEDIDPFLRSLANMGEFGEGTVLPISVREMMEVLVENPLIRSRDDVPQSLCFCLDYLIIDRT